MTATNELPYLTRMTFGKAIERLTAAYPRISRILEHLGGASRPDFVDENDSEFELTTSKPGAVASHPKRDYLDPGRLGTYDPIPNNLRFNFQ